MACEKADIERALRRDYSADPYQRDLQLEARARFEAAYRDPGPTDAILSAVYAHHRLLWVVIVPSTLATYRYAPAPTPLAAEPPRLGAEAEPRHQRVWWLGRRSFARLPR
jgi:hypothetical protein